MLFRLRYTINCTCCKTEVFEKLFLWQIFNFIGIQEVDILFFDNYSIENTKYGEKNLNFHRFVERSDKNQVHICKIEIGDKFHLVSHCVLFAALKYSKMC